MTSPTPAEAPAPAQKGPPAPEQKSPPAAPEQRSPPAPARQNPPAPPPKKSVASRLLHMLIWLALLGVFALAFYLVAGHKPAASQAQGHRGGMGGPVTVTPATATKGNIGVYLEELGTVTPVYTASIFNQVTGSVVAIHFQEGQMVKKGDPLLDIDSRQYDATLLQAQGTLDKDQHVLGKDQVDLDRYRAAWARNAISKQQLDDQDEQVKQDQGTIKNDQGTVQYDQVQVDYCHILSPIDGRVGLRLVDPGNLVTASSSATPLVVVTQLQPITVIFTIPEDNLGAVQAQLAKGAKLGVDVFDRTAQTKIASGELLALDNQIDTTTGTVKVRAIFDNADARLFPNQFVNARLLVQTLEGVTLLPSATIQQNGQTSFVYVIENGVIHQRTVKPGVVDNGMTQVEGINPGDMVANSSFDKLQDGDKVNLPNKDGKDGADRPGGGGQSAGSPRPSPPGDKKPTGGHRHGESAGGGGGSGS